MGNINKLVDELYSAVVSLVTSDPAEIKNGMDYEEYVSSLVRRVHIVPSVGSEVYITLESTWDGSVMEYRNSIEFEYSNGMETEIRTHGDASLDANVDYRHYRDGIMLVFAVYDHGRVVGIHEVPIDGLDEYEILETESSVNRIQD